jgi:hypothetical protein
MKFWTCFVIKYKEIYSFDPGVGYCKMNIIGPGFIKDRVVCKIGLQTVPYYGYSRIVHGCQRVSLS